MSCCGKSEPLTASKIVHGAIGLTKAALQIDRPSEETIQSRRDICRACDFASRNDKFPEFKGLTSFSICSECSCLIAAKTVIGKETCPESKW